MVSAANQKGRFFCEGLGAKAFKDALTLSQIAPYRAKAQLSPLTSILHSHFSSLTAP